jgi:hypothetical protein
MLRARLCRVQSRRFLRTSLLRQLTCLATCRRTTGVGFMFGALLQSFGEAASKLVVYYIQDFCRYLI